LIFLPNRKKTFKNRIRNSLGKLPRSKSTVQNSKKQIWEETKYGKIWLKTKIWVKTENPAKNLAKKQKNIAKKSGQKLG